jgi:hypothetical protein
MLWKLLIIGCGVLSTLVSIRRREWIVVAWSACLTLFQAFNSLWPDALPWRLHYLFFAAAALLLGSQVAKDYRRYKEGLAKGTSEAPAAPGACRRAP